MSSLIKEVNLATSASSVLSAGALPPPSWVRPNLNILVPTKMWFSVSVGEPSSTLSVCLADGQVWIWPLKKDPVKITSWGIQTAALRKKILYCLVLGILMSRDPRTVFSSTIYNYLFSTQSYSATEKSGLQPVTTIAVSQSRLIEIWALGKTSMSRDLRIAICDLPSWLPTGKNQGGKVKLCLNDHGIRLTNVAKKGRKISRNRNVSLSNTCQSGLS